MEKAFRFAYGGGAIKKGFKIRRPRRWMHIQKRKARMEAGASSTEKHSNSSGAKNRGG